MVIEPTATPEAIRNALINYRVDQNLSLRAAAKKIGGITGASLSNIERGVVWPTRKTLLRLERFLQREGALREAA